MQIVEQKVTSVDRALFELDEFFGRPLFAHLATNSEHGPRESPVWFLVERRGAVGHRRNVVPDKP